MTKAEKVAEITRILEFYYPETPIPLDHKDHYSLLVAVLLSTQCTDKRVNQVTPALFKLADTPAKMVQQKVEDIAAIIRPCGLSPRKSKAIHQLSQILLDQHDGIVPNDMKALKTYPA